MILIVSLALSFVLVTDCSVAVTVDTEGEAIREADNDSRNANWASRSSPKPFDAAEPPPKADTVTVSAAFFGVAGL